MSDKQVQPGGRVDKDVYDRFRNFVREKHGSVRGNLGSELQKAMEDRMDVTHENSQLTRIENDVATIKAQLSDPEADGGETVTTRSQTKSTHTRKPAANQPRGKKVAYLIDELLENVAPSAVDRDGGELSYKEIRNTIQSEYGVSEQIRDEYATLIIDELDAQEHPKHGKTVIWGYRVQEVKDELRKEAEEKL